MASRIPNRPSSSRSVEDEMLPDDQSEEFVPEDSTADADSPSEDVRVLSPAGDISVARRNPADYVPEWVPRRLRNSIVELTKVTWPNTDDVRGVVLTVLAMVAIFALLFGLLDLGFSSLLHYITTHLK